LGRYKLATQGVGLLLKFHFSGSQMTYRVAIPGASASLGVYVHHSSEMLPPTLPFVLWHSVHKVKEVY